MGKGRNELCHFPDPLILISLFKYYTENISKFKSTAYVLSLTKASLNKSGFAKSQITNGKNHFYQTV